LSYQLSAISYQLSVISYQLSAYAGIRYQPGALQLSVIGYQSVPLSVISLGCEALGSGFKAVGLDIN
jgi:hypothetical protein